MDNLDIGKLKRKMEKNLLNEFYTGQQLKVGDYITSKFGKNLIGYGKLVKKLSGPGFKAAVFSSENNKTTGKAKFISTNNWANPPKLIDKNDIPAKILTKIDQKAG